MGLKLETDPYSSSTFKEKSFAAYGSRDASKPLSGLYLDLMEEQRRTWPDLAAAYESLGKTMDREIRCAGFTVRVQRNPGRVVSTLAPVTGGSIDGRPCFLCLRNLPPQQKGILYCDSYLILPNPMPVFPFHSTVAHVRHQPQAIAGNLAALLRLINDLGDGWTVLYNGPKCGASAPDHLHFQIVPSGRLPVEDEIGDPRRLVPVRRTQGATLYRARGLGRQAIVLVGLDPRAIEEAFRACLEALQDVLSLPDEPMMNIVGFRKGGLFCLTVFPRRKHRPDAFFRSGDDRILLSPAVVEMAGVLVTPAQADFGRLDPGLVEAIFKEVSLEKEILDKAFQAMEHAPSGHP